MEQNIDNQQVSPPSQFLQGQSIPNPPKAKKSYFVMIIAIICLVIIIVVVISITSFIIQLNKPTDEGFPIIPTGVIDNASKTVSSDPIITPIYMMQGDSMYPTYQDRQVLNIKSYNGSILQRGDVIFFENPVRKERKLVKRIVGLPGEKFMIKDESVYINNNKLSEPYLTSGTKTYPGIFLKEAEEVVISENNYIVLGDNRTFSSDSREWGFITKDSIIAKVVD